MELQQLCKVNLCSGAILLDGWINIDINKSADIVMDLEKELLPFPNHHVDILVCISAINYFTRERAIEVIKDVFRVLKPGGIVRFATQDLLVLASKYVSQDRDFFFQKLADGRERFPGRTMADKFNEWFYGFQSNGKYCRYVYDYESLKVLFEEAGFVKVKQMGYLESQIMEIYKIDNRPEQMFFLEAVKPD